MKNKEKIKDLFASVPLCSICFHIVFAVCAALILFGVFRTDATMVNGIVMGKVSWFHRAMVLLAVCMALSLFFRKRPVFDPYAADVCILLLSSIVLFTYYWFLDPEPEKRRFAIQLLLLWFLLRYILQCCPRLAAVFLFLLMATALGEALIGMRQLYGYTSSSHAMFRLTGTFYNPGPYSGYLATLLPVCIGVLFATSKSKAQLVEIRYDPELDDPKSLYLVYKKELRIRRIVMAVIHYFAWVCVIAIVVILPAGMSRSAWIAAAVSSAWVWWRYAIGWGRTKAIWQSYNRWRYAVFAGVLIVFAAALVGIYSLKKDSADGRLLMWKVTAHTIAERPFIGHGLGGFPAAYAEAQAAYFASGKATDQEKRVAGCPEYAFNEYLQIASELGIPVLLFFLTWLGLSIYAGIKNRRFGVVGGIMALGIFALSSYPLQLPSFWIVLVFLSALVLVPRIKRIETQPWGMFEEENVPPFMNRINKFFFFMMLVTSCIVFWMQRDTDENYRKWSNVRMIYHTKAYEAAIPGYKELYNKLKHKPEFLFEYGQCLNKTKEYIDANWMFKQATWLSADPMIHYMQAKNRQEQQKYEEAEAIYLHALNILPDRIYPYYLLVKLYNEPGFLQPEKRQAAADSVLRKEPKVMTTAIREMREEVEEIMNDEL
ncbi:O-antigen ligase [Parabacteroides sp. PFB2-10]|uniref:O-antigen ligase family protein n=1 Tax=Parabacteroides sp. PFB2-10 TaxID=1742405 RepID=UPI002475E294|nr:O-antigen ligase family protein [Parabacteroides sp. PFB2-10]MDH6313623.1 O-antigen ligase [Parabacteroides sp. PFB2-10]MDL2245957.1 O-antigen ligase family protein [Parabacteroides sp. OttesenSCG-928-J18]